MASTSCKTLLSCAAALLLIALVGGSKAPPPCNIDASKLNLCRAAVTGSCPPPTKLCCKVVEQSNLSCLCGYKSLMPALGINPKCALALPQKCRFETPPECRMT